MNEVGRAWQPRLERLAAAVARGWAHTRARFTPSKTHLRFVYAQRWLEDPTPSTQLHLLNCASIRPDLQPARPRTQYLFVDCHISRTPTALVLFGCNLSATSEEKPSNFANNVLVLAGKCTNWESESHFCWVSDHNSKNIEVMPHFWAAAVSSNNQRRQKQKN